MQRFGIDTSRWQGNFDFKRAKEKEGVEFAILKIGGGDGALYKDSQFDNSYNKCIQCGLPKGCYFFGEAMTIEEAKKEANYWLELMKGYKFEYPVFYDVEAKMLSLDKRTLTEIIKTVCNIVEKAGYWVGIYTSGSHFNSEVFDNELSKWSHWVASWSVTSKPALNSKNATQMWQFGGSKNSIRSTQINGQTVDQNYCYIDYPTAIKANGLNGYGKANEVKPESKPETLYRVQVGAYSVKANAENMLAKLKAAGFDGYITTTTK